VLKSLAISDEDSGYKQYHGEIVGFIHYHQVNR